MKTATVRDLRNRYTTLLSWISAGEEVLITQRGTVVAKLSPAPSQTPTTINWAESPEVKRDRREATLLSAETSASLISEASGKW